MKTKHFTLIVFLTWMFFSASLLFVGCSGSEETEEEITEEEQPVPKETVQKPAVKKDTVVVTTKDTVQVQVIQTPKTQPTQPEVVTTLPTITTVFSVQIGAFHNAQYAEQTYRKAMQNFTEPVYKDYDALTKFHRVTVGNFRTKADALEFRQTCVKKGYKDAWVIEVERTELK